MVSRIGQADGFTLIEVLTTSVLTTLMFAALFSFYRSQLFTLRSQEVAINVKEEVDVGVRFITRELRVAGARPVSWPSGGCAGVAAPPNISPLIPSCSGFERISDARPDRITIQYDFRGDGVADPPDGCPNDAAERLAYRYDAATRTLRRTAGAEPEAILVRNVPAGGFQLVYRDEDRTVLVPASGGLSVVQRAQVATIEVTLVAETRNPNPSIPGQIRSGRASAAFLRNPRC